MSWDVGQWRGRDRIFQDRNGPPGLGSTPIVGRGSLPRGSLKRQTSISQEREGSHRETIISFSSPRQFLRTDAGLVRAVDSLSEGC